MTDRVTNYLVPEDSNENLSMPNIEKEVADEIERLTLEVINEVKEFFNVGIDFSTIEYIEDELKERVTVDYNLNNLIDSLVSSIKKSLNLGELDYRNLFEITGYNNSGKANVKIIIPLPDSFNDIRINVTSIKKRWN